MTNERQLQGDLIDAIIAQVRANPNLPAIVCDGVSVSYEDLASRSAAVRDALSRASAVQCPRVLLALRTSPDAYAGMVGVLMAGGAFCPINVEGPAARNDYIAQ